MFERLRSFFGSNVDVDNLVSKMDRDEAKIEHKERRVRSAVRTSDKILQQANVIKETIATGNWATDLLLDRPGRN